MARIAADGADTRTTRTRRFRRDRGAAIAEGARQGAWTLGRVILTIAKVVAAIIVAGIALVVLKANPSNEIVRWVTDAARWLSTPFHGIFSLHTANATIAVNWGLAAAVYLLLAGFIARRLAR
jgi:hypothetical protein